MSELLLSFLIALAILAALFVFVPMLHLCNDRCRRIFLRQPRQPQPSEAPAQPEAELRNAA